MFAAGRLLRTSPIAKEGCSKLLRAPNEALRVNRLSSRAVADDGGLTAKLKFQLKQNADDIFEFFADLFQLFQKDRRNSTSTVGRRRLLKIQKFRLSIPKLQVQLLRPSVSESCILESSAASSMKDHQSLCSRIDMFGKRRSLTWTLIYDYKDDVLTKNVPFEENESRPTGEWDNEGLILARRMFHTNDSARILDRFHEDEDAESTYLSMEGVNSER